MKPRYQKYIVRLDGEKVVLECIDIKKGLFIGSDGMEFEIKPKEIVRRATYAESHKFDKEFEGRN